MTDRELLIKAMFLLEDAVNNEDDWLERIHTLLPFIQTQLAQRELEPMELETVYETIIGWDEGGKRSCRELARRIVALYTAPQPAQKPLTDEEWLKWWQVSSVMDNTQAEIDFADFILIARAIEAAHGIKDK